jgi:hypothetical protein
MQEGQDFIAGLKRDCASAFTPAPGAFVFEGSWSSVFDSVMSHLSANR